jgi:hypothetical protein
MTACILRGSRGTFPLSKMFWSPKRNLALPYTPQCVTHIITQSSHIENKKPKRYVLKT